MDRNNERRLGNDTKMEDLQELINECSKKLQADPYCLRTRAIRGHTYMKAEMWELAVNDFTKILEVRQDDAHGTYSRGMALLKSGGIDEALKDFTKVLELDERHVMARYARAGCYQVKGQFNRAMEDYDIALSCDKGRIGLRESNMLYLHEKAGKYINHKISARGKRNVTLNVNTDPHIANSTPPNVPRQKITLHKSVTNKKNESLSKKESIPIVQIDLTSGKITKDKQAKSLINLAPAADKKTAKSTQHSNHNIRRVTINL